MPKIVQGEVVGWALEKGDPEFKDILCLRTIGQNRTIEMWSGEDCDVNAQQRAAELNDWHAKKKKGEQLRYRPVAIIRPV